MIKKIVVFSAAIAVLAVAAHLTLQRAAERVFRGEILPQLREKLSAEVSAEAIGVNMFTGEAVARGIKIFNPPGFGDAQAIYAPECGIRIGLSSLISGQVREIREIRLKDISIDLIKNENNENNLGVLLAALQGSSAGRRPASGGAPPAARPGIELQKESRPLATLEKFSADGVVSYLDKSAPGQPFRLEIRVSHFSIRDMAMEGSPTNLSGRIALRGFFPGRGEGGSFEARGRIGPVAAVENLSLEMSGSFDSVPIENFQPYSRELGLEAGKISGTINFVSTDGEIPPGGSELKLVLTEMRLTELAQKRLGSFGTPPRLVVPIPIEGKLPRPVIETKKAFTAALTSQENLESLLGKDLAEAARGIISSFKNAPGGQTGENDDAPEQQ